MSCSFTNVSGTFCSSSGSRSGGRITFRFVGAEEKSCSLHAQTDTPHRVLTGRAILHRDVVDVVPELLHLFAVLAVHHVHHRAYAGERKLVWSARIELAQFALEAGNMGLVICLRQAVAMSSHHDNWGISSSNLL